MVMQRLLAQVTVDAKGRITTAANVTIASTTLGNATLTPGQTTSTVGNLTLANANISGTATVSATFANSSMMLVPEGYITINVNGSAKKIPYYGV